MLLLYSIIFIVSFFVLAKSGGLLVKLTSRIAAFLEVSEFLFSFVIIGIATSLPEIFVNISAAFAGDSVLAFGNVVGSNILYPTFIIGVTVVIAGRIAVVRYENTVNKTNIYALAISFAPLALMWDLKLSRMEGVILFFVFVLYILNLFRKRDSFSREYHIDGEEKDVFSVKSFLKNVLYFVLGFILLYAGSQGVVRSASGIAAELNVPLVFISIFLVAFGTALPELVFSVQAALQGKKDIVIGNMLGSLTANSAIALGATAVISPVILENAKFFYTSAIFAFLSLALFSIFMRTKGGVGRREGMVLILFYALFAAMIIMG